jgi:hypothetical protein
MGSNSSEVIEFFSIFLILPFALRPGVDTLSNSHRHYESSWGLKDCLRVRLTTSVPSVSRLSTECGILDVSHSMGLHGLLEGQLYFLLYSNSQRMPLRMF